MEPVTLPATTRPKAAVPAWLVWKGSGGVLIIDDDDAVRTVLLRTLTKIGFSVSAARDGEEALALFNADPGRFKLVLLDFKLPGMDSKSILAALRSRNASLPVIMMSGYGREDAAESEEAACCDFLPKPFTMEALAATVRHAVGA